MKFIVEYQPFRKMVQAVGKIFPGMEKPDSRITLTVHPGMVIAATTCRAGAVLALATKEGQCDLPRAEFEGILATFKGEEVLAICVGKGSLKIKNFTISVRNFSLKPKPVPKYEWFGRLPPAHKLPPAGTKTGENPAK